MWSNGISGSAISDFVSCENVQKLFQFSHHLLRSLPGASLKFLVSRHISNRMVCRHRPTNFLSIWIREQSGLKNKENIHFRIKFSKTFEKLFTYLGMWFCVHGCNFIFLNCCVFASLARCASSKLNCTKVCIAWDSWDQDHP